ncbi:MAG: hypothetical protein HY226_00795 [Candidatus Vogelbacteria bacterium]|nr:hypothetical protein [Candidatus Vogelbacteria bacterium]
MENVAIFMAVFAISFFTISSVGNQNQSQYYNKLTQFVGQTQQDQKAAVLSSLYKTSDTFVTKSEVAKDIKIKSIDKTDTNTVTSTGSKIKKISIYLLFSDPKLKQEGALWRIHVSADVKTLNEDGQRAKFLNKLSIQEINNKYSYALDSGAFVFNLIIGDDVLHGRYTSTFTIHDIISGKKDQKSVTFTI